MRPEVRQVLQEFRDAGRVRNKGALSVVLVVTRHAREKGLPLRDADLLTEERGQVLGLGKAAVQGILAEHGIHRVLAEEGGRTSRGSVGQMGRYVECLNSLAPLTGEELAEIEAFWVDGVREYFAGKPLSLRYDASKSVRDLVTELLAVAEKRQREQQGSTLVGTVLQHLVGAKLELVADGKVEHHGASVADQSLGRDADFLIEDVAVHVTTAPSEALIRKCDANLARALRPLIVTTQRVIAEGLAQNANIGRRIDVFDATQFIAANIYELAGFGAPGRRQTVDRLIEKYNEIVAANETDPSLQIEIGR